MSATLYALAMNMTIKSAEKEFRAPVTKTSGFAWFGLVLCHFNHCLLFNTKFRFCLYIRHSFSKYI